MDWFGAPAEIWLLALKYVAYVLNQVAHESLGYKMPLQALIGQCPDISTILRFHFWQPVYYTLDKDENTGYSQPEEKLGRFVGFAENVGNVMCALILTEDTHELIP